MKQILRYIQQRLSLRLGLVIVLIITVVFTLLFGLFFYGSKRYIQRAAIGRASQLLDNTAERINGIMDETETVTNFMAQTTPRHLVPDSLLVFTHRTVAENAFLTGFAISMEPDFFPEMGRYYSAYSLRHRPNDGDSIAVDSITTVREGPFEYFDAVWYKTPRTLGTSCWVDAYPNSSAIMIGRTGTYLVHPDTAKLFRENIFSDAAPEALADINALGKAMLAGRSGMTQTVVDGRDAFIFYRPLQRTGWSIAIVCPVSDVFSRYNSLVFSVWIIVAVGLLLFMLFCYLIVHRAMQPLSQLDEQAKRIAEGQFDEPLPESSRNDSVGRLTNSFISMQQSLAESVASIRRVNTELQQQNDELSRAYQLKLETNRQKTRFIQDMYHEIRTPLNIISGFAQVLTESLHVLPADEVEDITARMQESSHDISRLAHELGEAATNISQNGLTKE